MTGTAIGILCVALFFVILAISFFTGHGSRLIAGYNVMKKDEKANYDEKKLCRGMGFLMLIVAGCCVVMGITEAFCTEAIVEIVSKVCAAFIILTCVVWIVLGNLFYKK